MEKVIKKRKIAAGLSALLIAASFAACGDSPADKGTNDFTEIIPGSSGTSAVSEETEVSEEQSETSISVEIAAITKASEDKPSDDEIEFD